MDVCLRSVSVGPDVTMLMRPAEAALPYRVLCGPRRTSIRCNVGEIGEGTRLERDRNIVYLDRDAGLDADAECKRADASQGHRCVHRMLGGLDDQRGSDPGEVGEFVNAGARQLVRVDDLNRLRHFLDGLLALLGSDDDLFEPVCGFRGLGLSRLADMPTPPARRCPLTRIFLFHDRPLPKFGRDLKAVALFGWPVTMMWLYHASQLVYHFDRLAARADRAHPARAA